MTQPGIGPSRRQVLAGVTGAVAGCLLPVGAGARASGPLAAQPLTGGHPADTALTWMATMYDLVRLENLSPPAAARTYAYGALGMYESVVGGMPRHRSLGGQLTGLPSLAPVSHRGHVDWPTALTAAVATVLREVLPFASPETAPLLRSAEERHLADRRAAGVSEGSRSASSAHGRAVAAALTRWIAADGHADIVGLPYTPPTGSPHLWESTPPNFRPAVEPHWAQVRPLVLRGADEVEPEPHLPFSPDPESPLGQQAMTTYRQSFLNTDEHRAIARFWTDNPGSFTPPFGTPTGLPSGHWMLICSQVLQQRRARLDEAVEAYARLAVTLHDAFLNCWTWKYRYNLLRPVTYVRRYVDPTWSTFVNSPQFPEYTSGHSVSSAAAAVVLTDLLGTVGFVDDSHAVRGMPARSFTSFRHAAEEAAQSRLYGGIHYPMGIAAGLAQGERVGELVLHRLHTRR